MHQRSRRQGGPKDETEKRRWEQFSAMCIFVPRARSPGYAFCGSVRMRAMTCCAPFVRRKNQNPSRTLFPSRLPRGMIAQLLRQPFALGCEALYRRYSKRSSVSRWVVVYRRSRVRRMRDLLLQLWVGALVELAKLRGMPGAHVSPRRGSERQPPDQCCLLLVLSPGWAKGSAHFGNAESQFVGGYAQLGCAAII